MIHPFLTVLGRGLLGGVWILAGVSKLRDDQDPGDAVTRFGILPDRVARPVGRALPWIETGLGVLLIAGFGTRPAAAVSVGLLLVFTVALVVNLLRGRRVVCRCFGQSSSEPISWGSVARNLVLLIPALAVALSSSHFLAVDGLFKGTVASPSDPVLIDFLPALVLSTTLLGAALLVIALGDIARALVRADHGPAMGMPERVWDARGFAANPFDRELRAGARIAASVGNLPPRGERKR